MLRSRHKLADHAAALERVQAWTRLRFKLADDAVVRRLPVACRAALRLKRSSRSGRRATRAHQFKVFKPVADVVTEDIPPAWLKGALLAVDVIECGCC